MTTRRNFLRAAAAVAAAGCAGPDKLLAPFREPGEPLAARAPGSSFTKAYATQSPLQVVDIHLPTVPGLGQGNWPCVLYVHGGKWQNGSRADILQPGAAPYALRDRGIVVASLDFRDADQGPWPIEVVDVHTAIRYLRAKAALIGIDPARIGLWGSSSGAHIAGVAGLSAGSPVMQDLTAGNPTMSETVSCVVAWSGSSEPNLTDLDFQSAHQEFGTPISRTVCGNLASPEAIMLGGAANPRDVCQSNWSDIDVSYWVYGHSAPPSFRIEHGTHDAAVPVGQARRVRDVLLVEGQSPSYVEHYGVTHGLMNLSAVPGATQAACDWVEANI